MVNLYKLTNLLESGMTIFQLNQWKNEGIWYPITQYKKESNEIEVVTNVFTPLSEEIEYYLNFLEKPETLYTFTEKTINLLKSLIK